MSFLSKPDRRVSAKARRRGFSLPESSAQRPREKQKRTQNENERLAFACEVASRMATNSALRETLLRAAEKLRSFDSDGNLT